MEKEKEKEEEVNPSTIKLDPSDKDQLAVIKKHRLSSCMSLISVMLIFFAVLVFAVLSSLWVETVEDLFAYDPSPTNGKKIEKPNFSTVFYGTLLVSSNVTAIIGHNATGYGFDVGYAFMPDACRSVGENVTADDLLHYLRQKTDSQKFKTPDIDVYHNAATIAMAVAVVQLVKFVLSGLQFVRFKRDLVIKRPKDILFWLSKIIPFGVGILLSASFILIVSNLPHIGYFPRFESTACGNSARCLMVGDVKPTDPVTGEECYVNKPLLKLSAVGGILAITVGGAFIFMILASLVGIFYDTPSIADWKVKNNMKLSIVEKIAYKVTCKNYERCRKKKKGSKVSPE